MATRCWCRAPAGVVDGFDTRDLSAHPAIRDRVGMIFQQPDNQIIATVVGDVDVAWALAVRGLPAPLIRERVEWALEATGIAELRDLPPHRLSGGQRQRLAIAGVLALRPACVIADEATAQLDPLARREIAALLHRLHREHGLTILHVTHLVEEAVTAHRVVGAGPRAVALDGTPAALFADLMPPRALKLAIPEPLALAERLRAAGVPLSPGALTVAAIARELAP